jgi:hypothetical protein
LLVVLADWQKSFGTGAKPGKGSRQWDVLRRGRGVLMKNGKTLYSTNKPVTKKTHFTFSDALKTACRQK